MEKKVLASELALAMGVMCNAIAVSLMIKSELGVSTISSVPVVLNEMFAHVTIGSWNFLFQVVLVVVMALITRKFLGYVFSIALALLFGYLLDFFELLRRKHAAADRLLFHRIFHVVAWDQPDAELPFAGSSVRLVRS
jgi:uncharacterized membrane protein YczE